MRAAKKAEPTMTDAPKPTYQRSARNYLLDKHFQLKYSGYLVVIALVMSIVLGTLLWRTSSAVVVQSQQTVELGRESVAQGKETVKQGQLTVERGKDVINESRKLSDAVSMQIQNCYGDSEPLKNAYKKDTEAEEANRLAEQKKFEADADDLKSRAATLESQAAALETRAKDIERGQRNMFIGLIIVLAALVVFIGLAGIVFTHKIAGPIFKMKRLMREVGGGKLVLREKLRKGDELQHFFETFEKMVEQMRDNQKREIERLEEIVEQVGSDKDAAVASLKTLIRDMRDHIEA